MRKVAAVAVASGVAAALGVGAWVVEREVVRRARQRPDPDADADFELVYDERLTVHTADGAELVTYRRGGGPTIVLSHGWTLTSQIWCKQFANLPERGFSVVAYDQRGHGASSPGEDGYSEETLAADLRAVLEALDLRAAVIVGHSMGGLSVQAFAGLYPDACAARVRGIVLLSTLARTVLGDPVRGFLEQVAVRAPDLTTLLARPDLGFLAVRAGFGREAAPSHVEFTRGLITACARQSRRDAERMLMRVNLTETLPAVSVPALVVVGSADVLTPPRGARLLDQLLPRSRLEVVEGGGHMLMLERTKELEDLVVEFAAEVGAAP